MLGRSEIHPDEAAAPPHLLRSGVYYSSNHSPAYVPEVTKGNGLCDVTQTSQWCPGSCHFRRWLLDSVSVQGFEFFLGGGGGGRDLFCFPFHFLSNTIFRTCWSCLDWIQEEETEDFPHPDQHGKEGPWQLLRSWGTARGEGQLRRGVARPCPQHHTVNTLLTLMKLFPLSPSSTNSPSLSCSERKTDCSCSSWI